MEDSQGDVTTTSSRSASPAPAPSRPTPWWRTPRARVVFFTLGLGLAIVAVSLVGLSQWLMAGRFLSAARTAAEQGDFAGSVAALNEALEWDPENLAIIMQRGRMRFAAGDLDASRRDFDDVIRKNPNYGPAYLARADVNQRQGRHREAIDDSTLAVREMSSLNPTPLNNRAYFRALANVELEQGLADVERAIELSDEESFLLLDTRGFLRFRLGQYDAALADLNQAEALAEKALQDELILARKHEESAATIKRIKQEFQEHKAVVLHHRGQVYEKLNKPAEAEADFKRALQLGYDPAKGVL